MNFFIASLFVGVLCLGDAIAKPGARIIGGEDAPAGFYKFVAAIYIQTEDSRYFCGGSLINHQWILTSGHCVLNATLFSIQLGSHTLTSADPDRHVVTSSEYILHPDFDPEKIYNDIALIKLRVPISYNTYIQPINLPPVSLLNQTEVTALGWGQTNDFDQELSEHLQHVKVKILSNPECQLVYGSQITEEMACVEGNFNEGACIGDTGGPLVEFLSRQYWIVGVSSFISYNGCESPDPSGYTRVFPFTDWIRSVINSS